MKLPFALFLLLAFSTAQAAVREGGGDAKLVNKLQSMVKEATAEHDTLKGENEKLKVDLEKIPALEKELAALKAEKITAAAAEVKLNSDLTSQKASNDETRLRLEATSAKLHEVIDKYNALNKTRNELNNTYAMLQNDQKATTSALKNCETKNLKLYESTKDILAGYQSCRNRGVVDAFLESEPLSQINNVEFETLMQEYEDKLRKQKYTSTADGNKAK
jgi:chromosome segregation ATPase